MSLRCQNDITAGKEDGAHYQVQTVYFLLQRTTSLQSRRRNTPEQNLDAAVAHCTQTTSKVREDVAGQKQ